MSNTTLEFIDSIRPINDNVLVQVFDGRTSTTTGIELLVTQNNAFIPDKAIVYNKGKSEFIKGQKVIIEKYKGEKFNTVTGENFILLKSKDIICLLDDDADVTIRQEL